MQLIHIYTSIKLSKIFKSISKKQCTHIDKQFHVPKVDFVLIIHRSHGFSRHTRISLHPASFLHSSFELWLFLDQKLQLYKWDRFWLSSRKRCKSNVHFCIDKFPFLGLKGTLGTPVQPKTIRQCSRTC